MQVACFKIRKCGRQVNTNVMDTFHSADEKGITREDVKEMGNAPLGRLPVQKAVMSVKKRPAVKLFFTNRMSRSTSPLV